jgi:hypothetical protein
MPQMKGSMPRLTRHTDQERCVDRVEQRFRQICRLSVSGPLLAALLFRELQNVLPFAGCLYMWLGPTGLMDFWFNVPEAGQYLSLYAEAHLRGAEASVWATADEAALGQIVPRLLPRLPRILTDAYPRHWLGNDMQPSIAHTFLRLPIRDHGRPAGALTVSRSPRDREFDGADTRTLQRLEPFISRALAPRREVPVDDLVHEDAGMLIVDGAGRIQSLSGSAASLLPLAQGSALAPVDLHEGLRRTVRRLNSAARDERSAELPAWSVSNAWGHFTARAYWLGPSSAAGALIGIFLERKVPRSVRMLENLHRLSLPGGQERVALLLALGRSEEQIARELSLTHNTVVYHRRQIYNRLDISNRSSLVALLSEPASLGSIRPTPD